MFYFEKYIHILALEMASPENQHCAICIGTVSFSIAKTELVLGVAAATGNQPLPVTLPVDLL